MTGTMLILGAGFSGMAIAREAVAAGWQVYGTTRTPERFAMIAKTGAVPLAFDGTTVTAPLAEALAKASHLVASVAPDDGGDPALSALTPLVTGGGAAALAWIGYLSTVGVYGDHGGGRVDEATPVAPGQARSRLRAAAEQGWQALAGVRAAAVLRLPGIYGPGRNALVSLAEGTARRIIKPGQVFNRVHVDDIAGATLFLAARGIGGPVNVADDRPAPPQDVVEFAARLMGVAVPPDQDFATAGLSAMAKSFYGENKRVANDRLKGLGYRLRHADYEAGLTALWRSGTWRG